jgi:ParB/RepB/Spo0J family partition protein
MPEWDNVAVQPLRVEVLGECYRRYRLADPAAEEAMARSLRRYGQLSPVVVCERDGVHELIDGFKRRAAASLAGMPTLSVRVVAVDDRVAKAAVFGLNNTGRSTNELEEAWIVQALVREDGLSQVEVAELLGKHKSWVNRRLAMLERLCVEAKEELRLGLVSPSLARQLVRLPAGNQAGVLSAARREALTAAEVESVVTLLRGATPEQEAFLLQKPREALAEANGVPGPARDPRLSPAGNRVARQLSFLLEALSRLENWLRFPGLNQLGRTDRTVLAPRFQRVERDARLVAELIELLRSRQSPALMNEVLTGA